MAVWYACIAGEKKIKHIFTQVREQNFKLCTTFLSVYCNGILLNTTTKREILNFASRYEVINTVSEHILEAS